MDNKRPQPPHSGGGAYGGGSSSGAPPRKRGPATEEDDLIDEAMDDFEIDVPMQPPEEGDEVEIGEAGRNWERPAVPDFDPNTSSIGAHPHTGKQSRYLSQIAPLALMGRLPALPSRVIPPPCGSAAMWAV